LAVIACIGCYDDESETPIRRNGKTATGVLISYKEKFLHQKREVIGNLHLSYGTYKTAQEILDMFNNKEIPRDSILFLDEIPAFLNSLSSDPEIVINMVNGLIAQSGKMHWDIIMSMQRFGDIPRRLRPHCDRVLIPVKIHMNGDICYSDFQCEEQHLIEVYSEKPYRQEPILIFDPAKLGKLYDSEEVIYDTLESTEKKKGKKKKQETRTDALCAEEEGRS
jgi:hypothetical protein